MSCHRSPSKSSGVGLLKVLFLPSLNPGSQRLGIAFSGCWMHFRVSSRDFLLPKDSDNKRRVLLNHRMNSRLWLQVWFWRRSRLAYRQSIKTCRTHGVVVKWVLDDEKRHALVPRPPFGGPIKSPLLRQGQEVCDGLRSEVALRVGREARHQLALVPVEVLGFPRFCPVPSAG